MNDMVGFRFHPSEQEIISYYLERKLRGLNFPVQVINEVNINRFEPWDLPDFSAIQSDDPVWYFFYVPDYMDGGRTRINRKTEAGFWKVTGKDRPVKDKSGKEIGTKKTLVYRGPSPNGTNWAMQEFHYKDATELFQRPFVLGRLNKKLNNSRSDGREEPSPPLASTSAVDIVPMVNHEPPEDLSWLDHNSLREQQLLLHPEQRPSCSHESIYEPDTARSQLDTSEQEEDDFFKLIFATDEEPLPEETVNVCLPEVALGGLADGNDSDVKTAYAQHGKAVETRSLFIEKPREPGGHRVSFEASRFGHAQMLSLETYLGKAEEQMGRPGPCEEGETGLETYLRKAEAQCGAGAYEEGETCLETYLGKAEAQMFETRGGRAGTYKKGGTSLSNEEFLEISRKTSSKLQPDGSNGSSRKRAFPETALSSHRQDPPSVYIVNIVVALILLVFFVREMVFLQ